MARRSRWRLPRLTRWRHADADAVAAADALADADGLAPGERSRRATAGSGLALGNALGSGRSAIGSVLISMKPDAGRERRRLEALLREDRLDLVRRDGRVLEPDLPARPAGVVDRELEPGVGERGQEDEDEARDRDDSEKR